MKKYRMAVCKGPVCRPNGSDQVFTAAKGALAKAGLERRCELYRGGCYGLCHLGPNVVVREDTGRRKDPFSPEDYQLMGWEGECHYGAMSPEKITRVVTEHIGQDKPVADFIAPTDDGYAAALKR